MTRKRPFVDLSDLKDDDKKGGNLEEREENIRNCLKMIRSLETMPNDILPNGLTASQTAHQYVMQGKLRRCDYRGNRRKGSKKK